MSQFPIELVGQWKYTGTAENQFIRFTTAGIYLTSNYPEQFTISDNGQQLEWGTELWSRKYGDTQTLIGVWDKVSGSDVEVIFREDHTTFWHGLNNNFMGVWNTLFSGSSSTGQLVYEKRIATCEVNSNNLIFSTVFGGQYSQTYNILDDVLTLTNDTGSDNTFERV